MLKLRAYTVLHLFQYYIIYAMSNGDLTQDGNRSTSPVNIPRFSDHRQNRYGTKSAPCRHAPLGSSLVDSVIDESDVMMSSSVGSGTGLTMGRKGGEMGEFSARPYGAVAGGEYDREIHIPPELEQSAEIAEDYVKIASRNKRAEHATTYIY